MKTTIRFTVLLLGLILAWTAGAQPVLSIDLDERNVPLTNTASGFSSFTIASNTSATAIQTTPTTRTFGSYSVTLSGSGVTPGHDDRLRGQPNNTTEFTESTLLQDFVFSRDTAGNDGLDVSITGLAPDQLYRCAIWSFDASSAGTRVSDWFANGTLVKENYTFDGRVLPANNLSYQFSFVVAADPSGALLIQGRRKPSFDAANPPVASFGVFLNALQVEPTVPEPKFFVQPASASRGLGDRVRFLSVADGVQPVTFQWYKGETEIPGATSNVLTLSDLTLGDAGDYKVVAANASGMATSVVATLTVVPDPPADVAQGLVSHWPMDLVDVGPAGVFTPDLYSHNDMLLVAPSSAVSIDTGVHGNSIGFNGVDQYGYRSGGFPIYNNPAYTVALWVRGNGIGQNDRRFFSESSTNLANPLFNLGTEAGGLNGTVRVFIRNDGNATILSATSTRPALDGNWHHVVWTETNGQGKLYIDGLLDETTFNYPRGTLTLNQTTVAAILRATAGNFFGGALDDVAVWNRVLTYTEIQSVRTNSIPPPVMIIPPAITQDPASQSVFTGTKVTFSFQAIGTSPLFPQWRKGGVEITDETNNTLMLPPVMLSDAGDYDVVVTNEAGRATSQVATLTVTLRPPPPISFGVDFNNNGADDNPANTEAGFGSFSLPGFGAGPVTRSFGGADVTLTAIGTTMESRKRATPVNGGAFTEERLLQDFVFARDATTAQGLDLNLEFLEPNAPYRIGIWSFDSGSTGARVSDWTANGSPARTGWTFDGNTLPADSSTYRFNFDTTSDPQGTILIQGRRGAGGGTFNVFVNAIKVERRFIRVTNIGFDFFQDIVLTIEVLNPAATHRVLQKSSLTDPIWTEVSDAFFQGPDGNTITATFIPPADPPRFYIVVQDP